MNFFLRIFLYRGISGEKVDFGVLQSFLELLIPGISVKLREEFISNFCTPFREEEEKLQEVSRALASAKIPNPNLKWSHREPLRGEICFERRYLFLPYQRPSGILYDAWHLQKMFRDLIPPPERKWENIHLAITNQLFGTWDQGNRRYHYRTAFFGLPSLVSTTGLIEAPAKPRDFYFKLQMGVQREILRLDFQGSILDYEDPRMTEVLKGYVLQGLFYHLTGNPFCPDPSCRLFNAHWQEELIKAQLRDGADLCSTHREVLRRFLNGQKEPEWLF